LVPYKYYKNFKNFKWLRKLDNKSYIWNKLITDFFYNIEAKMLFVLNENNFKKFYNTMDLMEELKINDHYWLDFIYSPVKDGTKHIMSASMYKNKINNEADIFNDLGISFEKFLLVDWDRSKLILPQKVIKNINKKLEWFYYMDKKLNNYINFYLYEFWKQDIFMWEVLGDDIENFYYYGQNNKINFITEKKEEI